MPATTSIEPILEPGVSELLGQHNAEAAFQTVCEIARNCFPELRSLQVSLLDDPDEEGRIWVVLNGSLPASHSLELLQDQRGRYYELLAERLPVETLPPFGLTMDFQAD
jgi:hypothetical protein